jgi:bifunctional non-homologous end joining protein LigD
MKSPARYDPQKALLVEDPPAGDRWVHELKLDGFRMGILIDRRKVRIISRRGTDYTAAYPEIVDAARSLRVAKAVIDGEVVVLDERGVSRFQRLQQLSESREGLAYFAFDLLEIDDEDLRPFPLEERKRRLRKLLGAKHGILRFTEHVDGSGDEVFAQACALGAEGIISKRRDAPYQSGARSADWQKIKCVKRQEFVIGGFTDPKGSRVGVGSILAGYYEDGALRFAGKVGTGRGWSEKFSTTLRKRLEALEISKCPFDPPPKGWLGKNAHWVKPKLVAEVEFSEWTADGHVRHPSLQGLRTDKRPREVVRERETELATAARRGQRSTLRATPAAREVREATDTVVYPKIGVTVADLVALYGEIADAALPHVEGRPLTVVRMRAPLSEPDALRSQAAFAHHTARDQRFVSAAVPRMRIREQKKIGEYCYVDSIEALTALLASGVVEWHVWNARVDDVEAPDRVVFDIDPGEGVSWPGVVAAARRVRAALEARDLESWVKTTGRRGVHVVAPFRPEHGWDAVFEFSHEIASAIAREDPDAYTTSFDKRARRGRILIDYKRNHRTSIAVAGYSLRARPDGAISVPVTWTELARVGSSDRWTVENVRARVRRLRSDPWAGYWLARQRLRL